MWIQAVAAAAAALVIPLGLDLYMPVPEDNPLAAERIALGRRLFSHRRLSRDGSVSCATREDLSRALASYVRSILSGNSRFDRFVGGDRAALSPEEQRGLAVPRRPRASAPGAAAEASP